jgi:hypothetical protein
MQHAFRQGLRPLSRDFHELRIPRNLVQQWQCALGLRKDSPNHVVLELQQGVVHAKPVILQKTVEIWSAREAFVGQGHVGIQDQRGRNGSAPLFAFAAVLSEITEDSKAGRVRTRSGALLLATESKTGLQYSLREQQITNSDADLVFFLCEVSLEISPDTLNCLAIQDFPTRFVRVFFRIQFQGNLSAGRLESVRRVGVDSNVNGQGG